MEIIRNEREKLDLATDSSNSNGTTPQHPMTKSKVHTTRSGTQYVDVVDVIQSEVGWREIEQILDANLVQHPSSPNGGNTPSPVKHNDAA